jgi:rhodanese-related sulfurtransferase
MKKYQMVICLFVFMVVSSVNAMTIAALNDKITSNQKITIIDIRSTEQYQKSHIPAAINIPARLCPYKRLPRFGQVVVYGDGLNQTILKEAVSALDRKEGIKAEPLEGGFSKWIANNYSTTVNSGMTREELPYITYPDFENMVISHSDILLLDIRKHKNRNRSLTELNHRYPNIPVVYSPFYHNRKRLKSGNSLYVIIDNGDGAAEQMAHQMKSAGLKHFVILTGGDQSFHTPISQSQ